MPGDTGSRTPTHQTGKPSSRRLIDAPKYVLDHQYAYRRHVVIMSLIFGKDEATIFREGLEVLEDAARLEGLDDSDVEVAVAQFRRDVASILADVAENGIKATDVLEPPPMEFWGLCQACQRICPVGPDDRLKGHQSRDGGRCDGSGREPAWTCSPPGYKD